MKAMPDSERWQELPLQQKNSNAPGDQERTGEAAVSKASHMAGYLQGCRLEISPPAPDGTLPSELAAFSSDMASVAAVLAATGAAAGHGLHRLSEGVGEAASPALRVVLVGKGRQLPPALTPVLDASYALEREDVMRWAAEGQKNSLRGVAETVRRRACQQIAASAAVLGRAEISEQLDAPVATATMAAPRPQFVVRNAGTNAVRRALETAEAGILLVDNRRMATMSGFGVNYDCPTADLLNSAAAGRLLELADPRLMGCIRLRYVTASVIGTLPEVVRFALHKADEEALAATIFVVTEDNAKVVNADGADALSAVLKQIRVLAAAARESGALLYPSPAARKTIDGVTQQAIDASAQALPPLAPYYAGVADLLWRIAVDLHLLDHVARQADRLSAEVDQGTVVRAASFVRDCALPAARNVLAGASVAPEIRDARTILSYAQYSCSADHPELVRRTMSRILYRALEAPRLDAAIRRLVAEGLLTPVNANAKSGGEHCVDEVVFDPAYRLPDLVSDPRRPRQ